MNLFYVLFHFQVMEVVKREHVWIYERNEYTVGNVELGLGVYSM